MKEKKSQDISLQDQDFLRKKNLIQKELIDKNYDIDDFETYIKKVKQVEQINLHYLDYEEIERLVEGYLSQFSYHIIEQSVAPAVGGNMGGGLQSNSYYNLEEPPKLEIEKPKNNNENYLSKNININEEKPSIKDEFNALNTSEDEENGNITLTKQQEENSLTNAEYTVSVTHYEIQTGFLKNSYLFIIENPKLKIKTERYYDDFLWLRKSLSSIYPNTFIPPLTSFSFFRTITNDYLDKKVRYLNKFLNAINFNKLLRSSNIYENFILKTQEEFEKFKNFYGNADKPDTFNKYFTLEGYLDIKTGVKIEDKAEKINSSINQKNQALLAVNKCIKEFAEQMDVLSNKMNDFSKALLSLSYCYKEDDRNLNLIIENFAKISKNISDGFIIQKKMLNTEVREFFKWVGNNNKEFTQFYKEYDSVKYKFMTEFLGYKDLSELNREEDKRLSNLRKTFGYCLNRLINEYNFYQGEYLPFAIDNFINCLTKYKNDIIEKNVGFLNLFNNQNSESENNK